MKIRKENLTMDFLILKTKTFKKEGLMSRKDKNHKYTYMYYIVLPLVISMPIFFCKHL